MIHDLSRVQNKMGVVVKVVSTFIQYFLPQFFHLDLPNSNLAGGLPGEDEVDRKHAMYQ